MHARERRVRRKKRGRQPEKTKESVSFFVPLPSRAFSHARFARRTKNKERLLEIYRVYIPELAIIELFIVNVSGFVCG